MKPFWTTEDGGATRLYRGDVAAVLGCLPACSVQCVVTSPPYWGLRDYGVEGQMGCEPTSEEYVAKMVAVFREVKRVLRDDGTLWLNLGDTYSGGGRGDAGGQGTVSDKQLSNNGTAERNRRKTKIPSGNLVGIPWRVALALQADSWILRQDIIWHKPDPMPESVKNRCTKAHEYVFLLTKSMGYFYDGEAIKEPSANPKASEARYRSAFVPPKAETMTEEEAKGPGSRTHPIGNRKFTGDRNKRSVWTVTKKGFPGAHYATFPPALITPMVLAGTSAHGACIKCGSPWRRLVVKESEQREFGREQPTGSTGKSGRKREGTDQSTTTWSHRTVDGVVPSYSPSNTTTAGWKPTCNCNSLEVTPCVVLDPFIGSGTTAEVSILHGRNCWGIDISEKYLRENAIPRTQKAYTSAAEKTLLLNHGPQLSLFPEKEA